MFFPLTFQGIANNFWPGQKNQDQLENNFFSPVSFASAYQGNWIYKRVGYQKTAMTL